MKTKYYKQCVVSKPTENGELIKTAWLPEKFAKKNKYLELKYKGKWINGWKVVNVGTRLPDYAIMGREHLEHRTQTDI